MPQFFSGHPNPGNRVRYVEEELQYVPARDYSKGSTREFSVMKTRAAKVKAPKPKAEAAPPGGAGNPAPGAGGTQRYRGASYELAVPSSWKVHEASRGASVTITLPNGMVRTPSGSPALVRGVLAGYFPSARGGLRTATDDELVAGFQNSNPGLTPLSGQRRGASVHGQTAESILMAGQSVVDNQGELVWLVTAERPKGLFDIAFVSPEREFNELRRPYEQMLRSVAFF